MDKKFADYFYEQDVDSKVDVATQNFEKSIEAKNQTPEQVVNDFMKALGDANNAMRSVKDNKRAIINLRVNTRSFNFQIDPNNVKMFEEGKRQPVIVSNQSGIKTKLLEFLRGMDGQSS